MGLLNIGKKRLKSAAGNGDSPDDYKYQYDPPKYDGDLKGWVPSPDDDPDDLTDEQRAKHPWFSINGERYHFREDQGPMKDTYRGGEPVETTIPASENSEDDTEPVAGPKAREMIEAARIDPKRPIWVGYDPDSHGFREAGQKLSRVFKHIWISGVTGSGKTTWLINYMIMLAYAGYGFCYADPKGADSRELIAKLPSDRLDDLLVIDPANSDFDRVIPINPLHIPDYARDDPVELQKHLSSKIEDLKAIFAGDKYWGVNMEIITEVLGRAMMLSERDYTIIDFLFLLMSGDRQEYFRDTIEDDFVADAMDLIIAMDEDELRPTMKRVLSWVLDGIIRRIIAQRENAIDWMDVITGDMIVILRTAIDSKDIKKMLTLTVIRGIWSAVQERYHSADGTPRPYFIICDEFDDIASSQLDVDKILSKARSMNLSFCVACQNPSQLPTASNDAEGGMSVLKALKTNTKNKIIFTSEDKDEAKILMESMGDYDWSDLLETDDFRCWSRLQIGPGQNSQPVCPRTFAGYPQLRPMSAVDGIIEDTLDEWGVDTLTNDQIRQESNDMFPGAGVDFDAIQEMTQIAFGNASFNPTTDDDAEADAQRDSAAAEVYEQLRDSDDIDVDLDGELGGSPASAGGPTGNGQRTSHPYMGADVDYLIAKAVLDEGIARGETPDGVLETDDDGNVRPDYDWRIPVDDALLERVKLYTSGKIQTHPELHDAIDRLSGDKIHKEATDDGRMIRTTTTGRNRVFKSGDNATSGRGAHRDLGEDTYLLKTRLGVEMAVIQQGGGGKSEVDLVGLVRPVMDTDYSDVAPSAAPRIARRRYDKLRREEPEIAWLTEGVDFIGEAENSTGYSKKGQTVVNLAEAYNAGKICSFTARPDTARTVWKTLTDPPFVSSDDGDVVRFYNLKKIKIDGEQPVIPNASRAVWEYDRGRSEYRVADESGTVYATFDTHDEIFENLDAYPRSTADYDGGADDPALGKDGDDLTVNGPVIPERIFDANGGVDPSSELPTTEDFRVFGVEVGAGTARPPVDPRDALLAMTPHGELSLREAARRAFSDTSADSLMSDDTKPETNPGPEPEPEPEAEPGSDPRDDSTMTEPEPTDSEPEQTPKREPGNRTADDFRL